MVVDAINRQPSSSLSVAANCVSPWLDGDRLWKCGRITETSYVDRDGVVLRGPAAFYGSSEDSDGVTVCVRIDDHQGLNENRRLVVTPAVPLFLSELKPRVSREKKVTKQQRKRQRSANIDNNYPCSCY